MGLTENLSAWLLLRLAAGIASAWVLVFTASWGLARLARAKHSGLSGLIFSGVGVGIMLTGLLCLGMESLHISSEAAWRILGALALLVTFVFWSARRPDAPQTDGSSEAAPDRSDAARRLIACYGTFGFGYIIPATFLPVIARQAYSSPLIVGLFWPLFGLAAFVSTLAAARLGRQYDDRRILAVSFGIEAIGVALLAVDPTFVGDAVCALLVGGTFMVITMHGLREARNIGGAGAGRLMGTMTTAFAGGQIIGPLYATELVRRTGHFTAPLLTAAALMAAGSAVLAGDRPGRGRIAA